MVNYRATRRVLVVTGGHPFEQQPFFELLHTVPDTTWTHVEQPAATALFDVERAADFDAFLCYDMPGLDFTAGSKGGAVGVRYVDPPGYFKSGIAGLLDAGKPLIFMHHALAGWPAWPRYAEIVGGRFAYRRDHISGTPDSGYRHGVKHTIRVLEEHPITAGIGESFDLEDELYLVDIDESDKTPLLRSTHAFEPADFHSAHEAVCNDALFKHHEWTRGPGSNLMGWLKKVHNSTVLYLQPGDGPSAYANPSFRRLLSNAVIWMTSAEGRVWTP